jgi:hypothetical protein
MKTTNYYNTFIEAAEDCPVRVAEVPPPRGVDKTAALIQYELIHPHPYRYTSDDVLFQVYAVNNQISAGELAKARAAFFSKGQPCLRASPLTKRYGWGVHSDSQGRIALYAVESDEYKIFSGDEALVHLKAMRSKRK